MSHSLAEHTTTDVPPGLVLAVPLGSTEQHGPHLPLGTDTLLATNLAERLAAARPDVVVAPALPYGASGEHDGFPGTLSIGRGALELVLVELGRSADAFAGVVFVCGHGGNVAPLRRAVEHLRSERRRALAWWPSIPGADAHAGRVETSLVLAMRPDLVGDGVAGCTLPLPEVWHRLTTEGVRAVSPNGVLGDPTGATAAEGERLLTGLAAELLVKVSTWHPPRHH